MSGFVLHEHQNRAIDLTGFVPIPGYERYLINQEGVIYSTIRRGRFVKLSLSTTGYPYATLMANGASKGRKLKDGQLWRRLA